MVGRNYTFKFTDEEYEKYEKWCKENRLDGYHGAIGGSNIIEILPTSIGDIVVAVATVPVLDESGNPVLNDEGEIIREKIEHIIREL